jgi:hypothetical protein
MRRLVSVMVAAAMAAMSGLPAVALDSSSDTSSRIDHHASDLGVETGWRDLARSAIEPDPDCDANTPLRSWLETQVADVSASTVDVLMAFGVLDWAMLWTLGGDDNRTDEYFGINGEYTKEQLRRQREHIRFWTVHLDDVWLQAAHGSVLANDSMMVPLVAFVANVDQATAQAIVDLVQAVIEADPAIDFNHPIFTFNAMATPAQLVPGLGPLPAKVIMGDGILQGLEAIGLGDVAPDFVLAHEMGHQVQYVLDIVSDGTPESTRYTELMADGFAAYEVAHVRGATFRTKRLIDSLSVTFNSGDCAFDDPQHHGTPEQRERAAEWGIDLAMSARPTSSVVASDVLALLFDESFPSILDG